MNNKSKTELVKMKIKRRGRSCKSNRKTQNLNLKPKHQQSSIAKQKGQKTYRTRHTNVFKSSNSICKERKQAQMEGKRTRGNQPVEEEKRQYKFNE